MSLSIKMLQLIYLIMGKLLLTVLIIIPAHSYINLVFFIIIYALNQFPLFLFVILELLQN
jgi:hypothetical protein